MQVVAKLFINNGLSFFNRQNSRIICGIKDITKLRKYDRRKKTELS